MKLRTLGSMPLAGAGAIATDNIAPRLRGSAPLWGRGHQDAASRPSDVRWPFVTTHRNGRARRFFARLAIDEHVRLAAQPLMLAKTRPKAAYARILVPIDFSSASAASAEHAALATMETMATMATIARTAMLAAAPHAQLAFVTGFTLDEASQGQGSVRRPLPEQALDAARARLMHFVGQLDVRHSMVSVVARIGSLEAVTGRYAAQMDADLIVMPRIAQPRIQTLLHGSAAWRLSREVAADILVVPG